MDSLLFSFLIGNHVLKGRKINMTLFCLNLIHKFVCTLSKELETFALALVFAGVMNALTASGLCILRAHSKSGRGSDTNALMNAFMLHVVACDLFVCFSTKRRVYP